MKIDTKFSVGETVHIMCDRKDHKVTRVTYEAYIEAEGNLVQITQYELDDAEGTEWREKDVYKIGDI